LERIGEQPQSEDPRVRLAGERTLLAWIRTGLALMGFGFVVARFGLFLREIAAVGHDPGHSSTGLSLWIGIALVLLGIAVNLLAAVQHSRFLRRLERGESYRPPRRSLGIAVSVVLAVLGVGMTVYLLLLHT
jgi:putative membrane protein